MRNIPEVSQIEVTLVSVSCAKFRSEEYMVTSGQTNHFDLLMRLEMVNDVVSPKNLSPIAVAQVHDLRLTISPENSLSRHVDASNVSIKALYPTLHHDRLIFWTQEE